MTAIPYRNTVVAFKPEVTEGVPVAPASGADFIAIQDDFDMTPQRDSLENAEIKASIGKAPSIPGAENPPVTLSHYLRASGVEGQAPNYHHIPKGFFGNETVNSTQRTTTVGSTTSQLVLGAGGSDFPLGAGLLIKDPVNGSRIRVSMGNSSNNVPLSFAVPVAPATGVNTGKCVYWSPANVGHQSLTVWRYIGNAGATDMVAGAKVTEFGYSANAGELVNANFSLEGLAYYFDPITILSTDIYLDFEDDDGTWAAQIPVRIYKDPHEVAETLQAAMLAANPLQTPTVTYSDTTGKYTIKTTGTLLELLWNTGTNAANTIGDKLGFSTAADDTGTVATTGYTADNAQSYAAPYTPTYDASDPLAAKFHEVMIGTVDDYICFDASAIDWTSSNGRRPIGSLCAESGRSGSVITSREGQIQVVSLLNQYDAKQFARYRKNDTVRFQYSFGTKTGGNWNPGFCGYSFAPTCKIIELTITNDDGLATLNMTLEPSVGDGGAGEMFLGML